MDKVIIKLSEIVSEIVTNVTAVGKKTSKKRRKSTFFWGKKKVLQAGGDTGGCYKTLVTVTGVSWSN